MKRRPDIARRVRVVHLVRDPRAIYASRRGLRWCTKNKDCNSPQALCAQLRNDVDAFEELARWVGPNRSHQLRFEDLTANVVNETMLLYSKLGLEYGPSVYEYLKIHTKARPKDLKNDHSTIRNTQLVAHTWKRKLAMKTILSIQRTCNHTLVRLGYKLLSEEEVH
ncbi:hypothetical protein HPB48_023043 [Haemaphysalis longicornis]|uniref:Sulfotransferase n=1 Tax=Haemaphysalis longicornis TaxID=44386 RepID=A0A9J6G7X4_HAELO|nr:hypothetical protein HPB48_023043 [Haemaphysalis longicornis]